MRNNRLKQCISILLTLVMLLGFVPIATVAEETPDIYGEDPNYEHGYYLGGRGSWEGGTWIREVYDWEDMDQVFKKLDSGSMFNYGYVTIKLMADLSMSATGLANDAFTMKAYSVDHGLNNVVFDFNGHTLSATDEVSTTNQEYPLETFIRLYVGGGNIFTFTDSVGGGGIDFYSSRAIDNSIAALYVWSAGSRGTYDEDDADSYPAKVIFAGGTYEMTAKINKFASGTCFDETGFRGTVIADFVDVEINDGTFVANSEGLITTSGLDMCARELAAFGTVVANYQNFPDESNPKYGEVIPFEETGRTVINGGKFISDGYAIHHFDNCNIYQYNGLTESRIQTIDSHFHVNYPTINGGYFKGQMGFTGLTFTYSDGNSALNSRPASEIIPETAMFMGIDRDGDKSTDITDWDWDDLHDMQACLVISEDAFAFKVTPEGDGDPIKLVRSITQSDTFEITWTVPTYLEGEVLCQPTITVGRLVSSVEPKTYSKSKVTVNYKEYPGDATVTCKLYVLIAGEALTFERSYEVDVKRTYTVDDACMYSYVGGDAGWNEIVEGESCSFKIYPNDHYELTNPEALRVYVNDELVTPDGNGVYTVENVTKDLTIYTDGSAFTGYANLIISANGKTVTEKVYVGDTYTFKPLAEFGATVPAGSTFTGWRIGGKTYQPGDTYTVTGNTDIAVNAVFTGLYNITVENGTAYADQAHTQPISLAAENQVIYIVADEAPEGKVFGYWSQTAVTPGGNGWFEHYDLAQTMYTVYYSDVVITPVYETPVDNIVINGMTKPTPGVAIDNSDYTYKWGCSVPADSGYSLGICYWYDITDGEPEFAMSGGDVFQIDHIYRFKAKVSLYGDTIFPANAEDLSVTLTGIDTQDYRWTINEFSQTYEYAVIYFEFTCNDPIYSVTVNDGQGSGEYLAGDSVTIIAADAPAGHRFVGWEGSNDLTFTFGDATSSVATFTMPGNAVNLSAIYEPIIHLNIYAVMKYKDTYTTATAQISHTTPSTDSVQYSNDKINVICAAGTHTVIFDKVLSTVLAAVGFNFLGWQRFEPDQFTDCSVVANQEMITTEAEWMVELMQDAVLVAVFEPKGHTVSFDPNGGSGTMEEAPFVDGEYILPICSFTPPEGKQFSGWKIGEDSIEPGVAVTIATDTVVYAVWEDLPRYMVSYNGNGGDGTMVGDMVIENGVFTLAPCTYVAPEGYQFKAWAIGNVAGEQKQPGEEIVITGETYIYAVWEEKTSTVLYGDVNADGDVDAKDALLVLQAAVEKIQLTDTQKLAAKVNKDEVIDAKDALLILQKAVEKIDKFPVEG